MAGFDYTYYNESFGGELGEAEFEKASAGAKDIVALLVGFDVCDTEDSATLRALCLQTDYTADSHRGISGVKSESLGDYSVSYSEAASLGKVSLLGNEVCPEALAALVA